MGGEPWPKDAKPRTAHLRCEVAVRYNAAVDRGKVTFAFPFTEVAKKAAPVEAASPLPAANALRLGATCPREDGRAYPDRRIQRETMRHSTTSFQLLNNDEKIVSPRESSTTSTT